MEPAVLSRRVALFPMGPTRLTCIGELQRMLTASFEVRSEPNLPVPAGKGDVAPTLLSIADDEGGFLLQLLTTARGPELKRT